jgi:hypothetical protein
LLLKHFEGGIKRSAEEEVGGECAVLADFDDPAPFSVWLRRSHRLQPRSGYGGTYVFGLTSTAFIWSEARRKMTHALARMPLLDAIIQSVCLPVNVCPADWLIISDSLQYCFATTATTPARLLRSSRKTVSHAFDCGCTGPNLNPTRRRSRRKCHPRHVGI